MAGSIYTFLCQNENYEISICSSSKIKSKHKNIITLGIDWKKQSSLRNICKGKDIIIHCASPDSSFSEKYPLQSYEFSEKILSSFVDEAIYSKVKKFIYFSSTHIYLNCWKLVVNDFCKQVVLNKEILINSDGNQVRNFVSLNEVSRLIDFIISQFCKGKFIPTVFNFGGDWTLSILDMAKLVAKQYKKNFEFSPPIIIRKKSTNLIPKLNFNFDLIVKSGFKPNNNNMADINELFLYVKNNFSDVR